MSGIVGKTPPKAPLMTTWPGMAPYEKRLFLGEAGGEVAYFEKGDPSFPVCLLIHGLGDEADSWRHIFAPLSRTHRVLAVDLPGFGRSAKPRRPYGLSYLCRCLRGFLRVLGVERALLIGSSLGAMAAQLLALESPGLVDALVLADGSLLPLRRKIGLGEGLFLTPGAGEFLYSRLARRPEEAYASLGPYYADLPGLPEEDRLFLYNRVKDRVADGGQRFAFFALLRALAFRPPWERPRFRRLLRKSPVPALLIWGEEDRIVPLEAGMLLKRLRPEWGMAVIPRAGHLPHQEQPRAFLDALFAWLERSPSREADN